MPNSLEIEAKSHRPAPQGYVLGAEDGEHLIHFRDGGEIFIKVDPVTGSDNLGLGMQQLPKGSGHSGSPTPPQGRRLLRSRRPWHGHTQRCLSPLRKWWNDFHTQEHLAWFQQSRSGWIMVPPGLDGFFRETCSRPGEPRKELTREQINAIALKYGQEFR